MSAAALATGPDDADNQLFLFSGLTKPLRTDKSKPKFEFTGERLKEYDPERYEAVVALLSDPGVSLRQICDITHCSHNTVRAVAATEKIPIDTQRKVIVDNMAYGLRLATEQIIEKLPGANVKDATFAAGVLSQNLQLQSGGVTARVEIVPPVNIIAKFQEFCGELEKRVKAREIGFADQKKLTKGGDDSPVTEAQIVPESDSATDVPSALPKVIEQTANDLANEPPAAADVEESPSPPGGDGGGGGAAPDASPQIPNP